MLHVSNQWGLIIPSVTDGTQPAAAEGASVTPGNNTYGAYATIMAGAALTDDAYGIWINANSNGASATSRDALLTIGFDPAGGTSFTGLGGVTGNEINHLIVSSASAYNTGGGVWYFFPLFIKAGTSIGAKASVNNATVGTINVFARLLCQPSRPDLVRAGSFVRTFGATTASSNGTAITPGTVSDGAYVQLGAATADPLWFWQVGLGNSASVNSLMAMHVDLAIGDATNKHRAIQDELFAISNTETISAFCRGGCLDAPAGQNIYVRAQGSTAAAAGHTAIAYGVGG